MTHIDNKFLATPKRNLQQLLTKIFNGKVIFSNNAMNSTDYFFEQVERVITCNSPRIFVCRIMLIAKLLLPTLQNLRSVKLLQYF